jgi:serine/threonine protein kinase
VRQERIATYAGPGAGSLIAGRYLLGERIGRGGMADVYAAEDNVLRRSVAVKLFRFETVIGTERQRVDTEIRTVAGLRHPGVVTVFDAGPRDEDSDAPAFVVMELIPGPSLAERLADGPLPAEVTASLGAQVASTLGYLHGLGIVHRDVKPANILLDATADPTAPVVKLTDFGIARLVDTPRLTAAGMTLGTADYIAPEQVTGADVGPPADVYSLGLVLLECLTGQRAFPGTGIAAAVARVHEQPHIPERLGPGWVRLLTAMTAPAAAARPDAAEVAAELGALTASAPAQPAVRQVPDTATTTVLPTLDVTPGGTRAFPTGPALHPRRRTLPRWALLTAAGIAAVLVALVIGIVASQHDSGSAGRAPTYPSVPGPLGQHLRQLESAVG